MNEDNSNLYEDNSSDDYSEISSLEFESDSESEDDIELDKKWLKMFNNYKHFITKLTNKEVKEIKLNYLYVNLQSELEYSKSESIAIEKGIVSKEKLVHLIKQNKTRDGFQYRLISLLKFNIDIDSNEIDELIQISDDVNKYMINEKYLYDIQFKDTIQFFQNINCLYFIFRQVDNINRNSQTKKIIFEKKLNKTKRKMT